mmetsp:Transcript_68273/g.215986  ORF Transcript_68273/g.215986 Transcript_68273/m.215986 type:complete len:243 (+) Transcript_68273:271-999(+)
MYTTRDPPPGRGVSRHPATHSVARTVRAGTGMGAGREAERPATTKPPPGSASLTTTAVTSLPCTGPNPAYRPHTEPPSSLNFSTTWPSSYPSSHSGRADTSMLNAAMASGVASMCITPRDMAGSLGTCLRMKRSTPPWVLWRSQVPACSASSTIRTAASASAASCGGIPAAHGCAPGCLLRAKPPPDPSPASEPRSPALPRSEKPRDSAERNDPAEDTERSEPTRASPSSSSPPAPGAMRRS